MIWKKNLIFISFCLLFPAVVFCASWPAGDGTEIGDELAVGYEPSGAVWHSRLENLFIVGDDGDITELTADGAIVNSFSSSSDYEGITIADHESDYIYVGVENPDSIIEVDISTDPWSLSGKSWDLTSWMTGEANQGLEALTFVSTEAGDYFYAGLQRDGKIYVFDVNLDQSDDLSFIKTITLDESLTDISGLDYQTETQTLYAIFDSSNKLIEAQADGTFIQEYDLPGNDQEGVALVPACPAATTDIYLAEDLGPELWRYSNYPINNTNCVIEDPDEDDDEDGDPDEEDDEEEAEDLYTTSVRGKYLRVFKNGERVARKKIFERAQDKARAKISDLYSDQKQEVVVAGFLNKKGKIKLFRLTTANKLKEKAVRKLIFKKKKEKLALKLLTNKKKIKATFGKKIYRWKITQKLKLNRVQ